MALVIAMVMVLAMSVSVFAADTTVPGNAEQNWAGDTHHDTEWRGTPDSSVAVAGIKVGDTVKFYKVLGYNPDANKTVANAAELTTGQGNYGAVGWELLPPFTSGANAVSLAEFKAILTTGITSELAGKIGKNATGTASYTATAADVDGTVVASCEVDPELYIAIVTPKNAGVMYNPIFVASDYYKTGTSDASSTWTPVETPLSYSDSAMAKKSPINVIKEATEKTEAANETNGAKAVGVGDEVVFAVKTTIPEFADNYTAPVYIVSDSLSTGLELKTDSIKDYSATVNEGTYTKGAELSSTAYTIPPANLTTSAYKVVFNLTYLLGLDAATPIWIEYSATVTTVATENVNPENNTVNVEYSHEPSVTQEGKGKKVGDKTHHYSFTIDGNVLGDSTTKTTELVKVGLDKDGKEITQSTEIVNGKKIGALAGAEFKLYTDSACTTEYDKGDYKTATATASGNKIVSDDEGRLTINGKAGITGLDAGTYYLKEMKALDGYIKQQDATKIEIIPTYYPEVTWTGDDGIEYKSDDILKSYIVKINDVQTAQYTLNYEMDGALPKNDVTTATENMMTDLGNVTISNNGPVTTTNNVTTNTEGKILNTQGTELPSTGGIGTTLFYLIGTILVLGAGILLITRRRMSAR